MLDKLHNWITCLKINKLIYYNIIVSNNLKVEDKHTSCQHNNLLVANYNFTWINTFYEGVI